MKHTIIDQQRVNTLARLYAANNTANATQSAIEKTDKQLANHLNTLVMQEEEIKNSKKHHQTINNALGNMDKSLEIYHKKVIDLASSCEKIVNDIKGLFRHINDMDNCFLNIQSQLQQDSSELDDNAKTVDNPPSTGKTNNGIPQRGEKSS